MQNLNSLKIYAKINVKSGNVEIWGRHDYEFLLMKLCNISSTRLEYSLIVIPRVFLTPVRNQKCREKLYIGKEKPFITMLGIGNPVIVWNDTKADAGNRTFESATFGVGGDFFMAINMTFQVSEHSPTSFNISTIPFPSTNNYI